jgi:hypothetical protein
MYAQEKEMIIKHLQDNGECTYEEIHFDVLHTNYEKFKPILDLMVKEGLVIDNGNTERIKLKHV